MAMLKYLLAATLFAVLADVALARGVHVLGFIAGYKHFANWLGSAANNSMFSQ